MRALATVRPFRAVPHGGKLLDQLDVALDRPVPQSPDAERAVLGSVLINNNVWYRIDLSTGDFFKDAHATIYRVMALMAEERMNIEPLTLKEELARQGLLEQVGGVAYISSLLDMVPDVANVERYSAIVKEKSQLRKLLILGNKIMRQCLDTPADTPEEIAATAMQALSPVATREDQQARPLAEVLSEAYDRQRTLAAANRSVALDIGWPTLNDLKIFYPTLILCTAERQSGKSALMASWSRNLAANGHKNVMFSLESAPREIGLRYTSMETGIPHRFMRDWRPPLFTDAHHAKVAECLRTASGRGIFIGKGPHTIEEIVLEIRRLRAVHGIEAAFIDYLQLMTSSLRFERSELMFNHMAQQLLRTAMELDIAICAFSQVNKDGDVAYADSVEKSARVRLHFERDKCNVTFMVMKNNEERTEKGGFPAHFDEVTMRWAEGTHEQVGHGAPAERKLFT